MLESTLKYLFIHVFVVWFICVADAQQCGVIYVTPGGASSGSAGTLANPSNLSYAISLVSATSNILWLSQGIYKVSNDIEIGQNMTIEGGFDSITWTKSNTTGTVIIRDSFNPLPNPQSALIAFYGYQKAGFRLQDLTIQVDNAGGYSITDYGVYLAGCSDYNIVRCKIITGDGSPGLPGLPGYDGLAGGNGGAGNPYGNETNVPTGGAAGIGGGGSGGKGGDGADWARAYSLADSGSCGARAGSTPANGPACGCGIFGSSFNDTCFGIAPTPGDSGIAGVKGDTGIAGVSGLFFNGFYFAAPAPDGADGSSGCGGGGGGGGSGRQQPGADDVGGSGGGGGAGGGGGKGGKGGGSGGGSFAIFLYNNGTSGNIIDCQLAPGHGGIGAPGGSGGAPGAGGQGGPGGTGFCGPGFSAGASGGDGGAGGLGGKGGYGAEGLSGDLIQLDGDSAIVQNDITVPGNPPAISVRNYSCLDSVVIFTATSAGTWDFGNGALPVNGSGTGPISVHYSILGRKTITFSGTEFTDFVIILNNRVLGVRPQRGDSFEFRLLPNPASDEISLHLSEPILGDALVNLLDITGRCLKEVVLSKEEMDFAIKELSAGLYFIRVTRLDGQFALAPFIKM